MTALTRDDLSVIEGDARINDRRLSEALGFNRPNDLQRLIRAHMQEIADFGEVLCFEAKNPSPRGGRPIKSYMLNEHQSVALAMWAETPQARDARRQIIEVFVAARRGDAYTLAQRRQAPDRFAAHARHVGLVADSVSRLDSMSDPVRQLTHLPIWLNGRRPGWWPHMELRAFLTISHRQMLLKDCHAEALAKFGAVTPSISGLHRYWQRLDVVFGHAALKLLTPMSPNTQVTK